MQTTRKMVGDALAPPREWGLPEQFQSWRPVQEDALEFLGQSTRRVKALCAATGAGKSAIAFADALSSRKPTCYVTDSRALQNQILETFEECGVVDLRGRSNYPCGLKEDYSCDEGYAARCPFKGRAECPASNAEMRAAASWLVVTNYDKWIHSRKFGQGLSHIQKVIFDEGDEAPNALARAMQVILHQKEIEEMLEVDFPDHHEAEFFETWKTWAQTTRVRCDEMMMAMRIKVRDARDPKPSWVKHLNHLKNLLRRLITLSTANVQNWVVEEIPRGYQFDPIQPARYAESALLLRVPDIVVMSATLRIKTLFMMGIGQDKFDFKELPSDFDPARCPLYYIPTMRVDARANSLQMLWARLDQICAPRQDRNGLVHTISFTRRDEILEHSRFATKMFINERGEPATDMVEQFVAAYPGAILVSPSIGRGFDFKFKRAEWQFICKIPFPPPSKVLKARTEADREYPYYLAMQKFVQMVGRIARDKADSGESFVGDDHFQWFFPRYRHLAPNWFRAFVKEVSILPQPPRRLE